MTGCERESDHCGVANDRAGIGVVVDEASDECSGNGDAADAAGCEGSSGEMEDHVGAWLAALGDITGASSDRRASTADSNACSDAERVTFLLLFLSLLLWLLLLLLLL